MEEKRIYRISIKKSDSNNPGEYKQTQIKKRGESNEEISIS
ncbi:MAG: hypothetical protein ACFFBV_11845 [Promethearchaeota archaeon]